jgi:signal transduction histidine kinase
MDPGLGVLTTRIGRRFVWMFLGCAFLPLVAFALLALAHVSRELRHQNEIGLHDAAKTAGMGLAARFSQLAGDFELLREVVRRRGDGQSDAATALVDQLDGRSCCAWIVWPDRREALWGGGELRYDDLTAVELAHLQAGKPLVRSLLPNDRLAAFSLLAPGAAGSPLMVVELRRDWLWDVEELRGRGAEVAVFDGRRQPLFQSFESIPDSGVLFAAVAAEPASGTIEWKVGDAPHVARYWRAFLLPQYGLDLLIVQSRLRSDTLAAVHGFETWFLLLALGALLFVLGTSLVQMRRTLGPIVALAEATRKVAAGDFTARVAIASRDEFGDLGVAWNHMTGQLAENIRRREATERDLVASRDAALAAARAKAEFVTNVSHELRTPMAEILGATEILLQLGDGDPAARTEFTAMAHFGAERLSQLVDDVLDLGGTSHWELVPTDVSATLRAVVAGASPALAERLSVQIDAELPPVAAVDHRLVDTWRRLIDNAVKFSPDGTTIGLRASARDGEVMVEVVDHGVGIAPADLEGIFEPFQQVGRDQLTEKATGTGLGLSIVRNTVLRHGGKVEVDSVIGLGSTFRVRLPAVAVAAPAMA